MQNTSRQKQCDFHIKTSLLCIRCILTSWFCIRFNDPCLCICIAVVVLFSSHPLGSRYVGVTYIGEIVVWFHSVSVSKYFKCQFTIYMTIAFELCFSSCLLLSMSWEIPNMTRYIYMFYNMKKNMLITYPFLHINFLFRMQMTRTSTIIITKTPATEPPMMASEIIIQHICIVYELLLYFPICFICSLYLILVLL